MKSKVFLLLLVSYALVSFCLSLRAEGASNRPFLVEANSLYQKGEYEKAGDAYRKSVKLEPEDGVSWFNLGNTEYRLGKIGEAIFAFKMAEKFLPRDPDIKFNLNYIQSKTKDNIEKSNSFEQRIKDVTSGLSDKEGLFALLLSATSLLIFSLMRMVKSSKFFVYGKNISILFVLIFSIFLAKYFLITSEFGVVISEEVHVTSGKDKNSVVLFQIHRGAEFSILEKSDSGKWLRIRLDDGKMGWIKKEDVITNS